MNKEFSGKNGRPDKDAAERIAYAGKDYRDKASKQNSIDTVKNIVEGKRGKPANDKKSLAVRNAEWMATRVEGSAEKLIDLFERIKQSPQTEQLHNEAARRAVAIGRNDVATEITGMWSTKPLERFDAYIDKDKQHSPLAKVVEETALAMADDEAKARRVVITGSDKPTVPDTGLTIKDLLKPRKEQPEIPVVSPKDVRDVYVVLGIADKIDHIPDMPEPRWGGRLRSTERAYTLDPYGVDATVTFNSGYRGYEPYSRIPADYLPHVVLEVKKTESKEK